MHIGSFLGLSKRRFSQASAFTVIELLVSVSIVVLLSIAVVGDITRIRSQEELASSARELYSELRQVQSDALSALSVDTCELSGNKKTCMGSSPSCSSYGLSCGVLVSPTAFGVTLALNGTSTSVFADIMNPPDAYETASYERMNFFPFATASHGVNRVTISELLAGGAPVTAARVLFDRQSGTMHIHACASGSCEVDTLLITLVQSETKMTRKVSCNAITGRISLE